MWRLHWRKEFPFPQGIWILPWEIHFISHSKRHEGKLFLRQTLQGIKFLPTEDIPTAKARCQSFFSRKSVLTPNLDMAKVMPREEFLNALWLLPKYTISVISKKKSAQEPKSFMWARCGKSQNTPDRSPSITKISPQPHTPTPNVSRVAQGHFPTLFFFFLIGRKNFTSGRDVFYHFILNQCSKVFQVYIYSCFRG